MTLSDIQKIIDKGGYLLIERKTPKIDRFKIIVKPIKVEKQIFRFIIYYNYYGNWRCKWIMPVYYQGPDNTITELSNKEVIDLISAEKRKQPVQGQIAIPA